LRKPFLGIVFSTATEALVAYLGNPPPGGCYVVEVIPGSTLDIAGVQWGDMIYSINGYQVDRFGEMNVPWSEDKIGITDLVNRLAVGDSISFVLYRRGERIERVAAFNYATQTAIHRVYPGYEPIDYEIFGGMVVMELTKNHIEILKDQAPGLARYMELRNQLESVLVVTHIFSGSQVHRSQMMGLGTTLNEINGMSVHTLGDFRNAIRKGSGDQFFTMLVSDNVVRSSDRIFVVLPMQQLLIEEMQLSRTCRYPLTALSKELLQEHGITKDFAVATKELEHVTDQKSAA
jgi:S1-C subfamily serine protease